MTTACAHVWIDPTETPLARSPYSSIIGPHRWHMKPGHQYTCRQCQQLVTIPATPQEPTHE